MVKLRSTVMIFPLVRMRSAERKTELVDTNRSWTCASAGVQTLAPIDAAIAVPAPLRRSRRGISFPAIAPSIRTWL